jgi:pSer/pThr/pTyr-binding forkhead associated (FHA) protein
MQVTSDRSGVSIWMPQHWIERSAMQITLESLNEPNAPEFIVEAPEVSVAHPEYLIGRAGDCDLQLESEFVSRHHCELLVDHRDHAVRVRDLGSQNGTFVNQRAVADEQELKDGDELLVACVPFEIHIR